ncbi:anti-sigma B factor RsbW [Cohnella sp. LGH]|uniref:anti-sigma B factor RsbW n=1 Tax=unclassified Cohnella TaxID=2636738 RepID=UPI001ADD036F|nr:anti-sigma B factor RsbW [Cohnella sp. LGH]QTH40244.1 anti-sigma B factor RsbW [Cohnella sp. LGH]
MTTDREIKLTLPALPEYVDLVRLTLYGIASKLKFSFEEIEDMKVAVSEACNNAVLHAYGEAGGRLEVTFATEEDELVITVRDYGSSFTVEENKEAPVEQGKAIEDIRSGGLGLYLMQALMDRVDVVQDGGTAVTLAKKRQTTEEAV